MTRSRRLALKAAAILALGAANFAAVPNARAESLNCPDTAYCASTCSEGLGLLDLCAGCPQGVNPQCEFSYQCMLDYGFPMGAWCGYDT